MLAQSEMIVVIVPKETIT